MYTRTLFPETWLWVHADVDASGALTLPATAPDTITSWQLSAFATHATLGAGAQHGPLSLSPLHALPLFLFPPFLPYPARWTGRTP